MSRHWDVNRVTSFSTPAAVRIPVEQLRSRATRRKLVLLECGIIRYAPFADCGRTIWELLPTVSCFQGRIPPAVVIKGVRSGEPGPFSDLPPESYFTSLNGRQAIETLEAYVDGTANNDELTQAEEYFREAEWRAEGDTWGHPNSPPGELASLWYAVADWLCQLSQYELGWRNILDYYLANFSETLHRPPLHRGHRSVAVALIRDIFGHPFRLVVFDPSWETSTAVGLARAMYESRDFAAMPILADALEEAGCDNADILTHCRGVGPHVRGCWVVDLVLGKS